MKAYSVRDLKEHPGEIISGAQKGNLSLVTKHGNPVFVAVPLTELALEEGIYVALATCLYREHVVSVGKAAKIAKMPLEKFIVCLAQLKISPADYSAEELRAEVEDF
jgi:prevent-host-death family protein